jgi:HEAT repeat protein
VKNIQLKLVILLLISIIILNGNTSCSCETLTTAQTSVPLEINGEQVTLHSISLVINEPGEIHESDLIIETTQRLLARIGIEVKETGPTDATLTITQDSHEFDVPYEEVDTGIHTTLSGVTTDVEVTLKIPNHETITGEESITRDPGWYVPAGVETWVDPKEVIIDALFNALTDVWGERFAIASLKDSDENIRGCAAIELGTLYTTDKAMTPAPESITNLYNTWLNDSYDFVRELAYDALTALGSRAAELIQNLTELIIKDNEPDMTGFYQEQEQAGELLINIGPASVPALIQLLGNQFDNVRSYAARALGEIETNTPEVIQALTERLRDEDPNTVEYAAASLLKKEPEIVLPMLTEILNDKNESFGIRSNAALAMATLWKEKPEEVLTVFLEVINNTDENVNFRETMFFYLALLGPNSYDTVLPILIQNLVSDRINTRYAAARSLQIIGPPAMLAVPSLIDALKNDPHDEGKSIFASALNAITGEDFGTNAEEWQQWWEQQ